MAKSLHQRFDASVDRNGEHHLWTGAVRADSGTGRLKVDGKVRAAHQIAWELEYGTAGGNRVLPCPDIAACVRIDHLRLVGEDGAAITAGQRARRSRAASGAGSMRRVAPGTWELAVSAGKYDDGSLRREYRRVRAVDRADAQRQLAAFTQEVHGQPAVVPRAARDVTLDEAVERYLTEHLADEMGRERKTVEDYRRLHRKWFKPLLGATLLRDVDEAAIDDVFGRMRRAGLSKSRMNQARSLYVPFFRWARSRRFVSRNPMTEFQVPTSSQVSKERTPPEIEQLTRLLNASVAFVPDIAPVLTLGAVTGMRRGELAGIRRSNVLWSQSRLMVDTAVDGRRVKTTKTRKERTFYVDDATLAMLRRHCDDMNERAAAVGLTIAPDAFVFSLEPDCSQAIPPDYLTKRVAVLKDHLGVADKRPETIAMEDEALRLFREPPTPRPAGKTGPAPKGGLSYREIGDRLGRSERWAALAVASALRREGALPLILERFDASIVALRKFTSSELLDAGFNISMVAHRQGHGPQVLMKHYAKSRRSADRLAAEHLGAVVHQVRAVESSP
ncbi:MAG: site-specific integrase [Acidimicrobiales bacterium]